MPFTCGASPRPIRACFFTEAAPLLIVNAAHIDLVDNEEDYQALVEQVQSTRSGRHYFNPTVAAI